MLTCVHTADILMSLTTEGDFMLPLIADFTGTGQLLIDDDSYDFEAVSGENIVVPNVFDLTATNIFQLRRVDNTTFGNTCYRVNPTNQYVDETGEVEIHRAGYIALTLDDETAVTYTNVPKLQGALLTAVFSEMGLLSPQPVLDPILGKFDWGLESGQKIFILYFK